MRAPDKPIVYSDEHWIPIRDCLIALGIRTSDKLLVRSVIRGTKRPLRDELEGLAASIPALGEAYISPHRREKLISQALIHLERAQKILDEVDPSGRLSGRVTALLQPVAKTAGQPDKGLARNILQREREAAAEKARMLRQPRSGLGIVLAQVKLERDMIVARRDAPEGIENIISDSRKSAQTVFRSHVVRVWTDDIAPAIMRARKSAPTRAQLAEFLEAVECPLFPDATADAIERWLNPSRQEPTCKRRNRKPRVGK